MRRTLVVSTEQPMKLVRGIEFFKKPCNFALFSANLIYCLNKNKEKPMHLRKTKKRKHEKRKKTSSFEVKQGIHLKSFIYAEIRDGPVSKAETHGPWPLSSGM